MQNKVLLPPFENVGAGLRAILTRVPQGDVYDEIVIKVGGTAASHTHLKSLKVKLGGKVVRTYNGAKLFKRNSYNGLKHTANFMSLPWADITSKTRDGKDMSSLNTRDFSYSQFSIEVEVDAAAPVDFTMEAFALLGDGIIVSAADQVTQGNFLANLETTLGVSGAGTHTYELPTGVDANNLVRQIMFHDADDKITHIEILKDNQPVLDKTSKEELAFIQSRTNQRVPQANMVVFDAIVHGVQGDALDLRRPNGQPASMQYRVTTSAACQLEVSVEMLATLPSL